MFTFCLGDFLAYEYPIVPAPIAEDSIFTIEYSWHLNQKLIDHKCKSLFVFHQSVCLSLCQYHMVLITVASCKFGNRIVSYLTLFFYKVVLSILSSFHFNLKFKIILSISTKKIPTNILIGFVLLLEINMTELLSWQY